tara:strand:- start:58 stop:798 length:741 start_codon:yes stop_codon:yes gene_type:complete
MNNICIIPARMGSSRFPGKPLFKINGKELVKHVYDNCIKSNIFQRIIIATPDKEIIDFCDHINADSILTSNEHKRASDRCHEAILNLEKQKSFFDICTMVQGDEPMVTHNVIDKITNVLIKNKKILCANGFGQIREEELSNKNCIKVLKDLNNNAIYMSRQPIPWIPKINKNVGKQICVIPFQTHFLKTYSNLKETPLEISESIDMLRVIENGKDVKMVSVDGYFHPVDILKDASIVENLMKNDAN